MKISTILWATLLLAGCATHPFVVVPPDYVTGLKAPVTIKQEFLIMDGGSGCVVLTDAIGKQALVFMDRSVANQEGRKKSWHGREMGTIVLGELRGGRVLDSRREEAKVLLQIFDTGSVGKDDVEVVRFFADSLRKKEPNQSLQPTGPSARG